MSGDGFSYMLRIPEEWRPRIEEIKARIEKNRPPEVLSVSTALVLRTALRVGVRHLRMKYGESNNA
jgi:hypothetical protein